MPRETPRGPIEISAERRQELRAAQDSLFVRARAKEELFPLAELMSEMDDDRLVALDDAFNAKGQNLTGMRVLTGEALAAAQAAVAEMKTLNIDDPRFNQLAQEIAEAVAAD